MSYRSSMCLFIVFIACFVVLGCASHTGGMCHYGLIMSQQQQQTTTAHYVSVSGKTRKQRDLEIKNHVKQTEKELGGK